MAHENRNCLTMETVALLWLEKCCYERTVLIKSLFTTYLHSSMFYSKDLALTQNKSVFRNDTKQSKINRQKATPMCYRKAGQLEAS